MKDEFMAVKIIKRNFRKLIIKIPLVDRWLIGQLLPPMFFAIGAFTAVSLSVGIMFDLVRKIVEFGLPLQIALKVLILKLPGFLVLSFPMSMLLATLLAYGKLSSNSELLALKSLGYTNKRIIVPVIFLSLLMTCITFNFNDSLVPISNRVAENIMRSSLGKAISSEEGKHIMFSRYGSQIDSSNQISKSNENLTHIFYAKFFRNNFMEEVTLIDYSRIGIEQTLKAKKGEFDQNNNLWIFYDGRLTITQDDGTVSFMNFNKYQYPLGEGPRELAEVPSDANDMTLKQAKKAESLYQKSGNTKEARRMRVRIQEKFTLPAACLVFGLIGSAFGVRTFSRSSKSQGFGLSVLLIFSYYILSFFSSSLGVKGILNPFIAAWTPVFISITVALLLIKRASKI
ncbi:LptF/LptG family permease [uncultured Prochlorococcus sp.]|uniref:LptF/LptG family permease n=1 Tax=uncultured Prochlorococcus sp. TaxID=159733 RepID=UPI002587B18B|nr:LptF/LptG family permease [uncultured Prochlorococcus sp.]